MMSVCLEVMLLCLFYHVLGENFDRQASIRRSLIYTDTVVRRPKKVKRRKTITGIPDNIQKELGMAHQNCIPSTVHCHCLSLLITLIIIIINNITSVHETKYSLIAYFSSKYVYIPRCLLATSCIGKLGPLIC